jgi:protein TonB
MSAGRLPFNLPFRRLFNEEHLSRVICVAVIVAIHVMLLCFLVFDIEMVRIPPDPPVTVMKLVDIEEYMPPPPPPPSVAPPVQNTTETIAEEIIGEETEPLVEVSAPVVTGNDTESGIENGAGVSTEPSYLPSHKVSEVPKFDENELKGRIVYPPIARRSGIEGSVILDLFIDREGYVRNAVVLKETPEGRGFAEAALKAFQGMKATRPAQANGEDVGVHYRWPVRFTLR